VGLFSAVSKAVDTLRIERAAVPYDPGDHEEIKSSCVDLFRENNTNVKPGWY